MNKRESGFVPIYKQLFEAYRHAILTQKYPPGSRIDSINEIQKKHQVSRETAKLVLSLLVKEGLIYQKPGKGSFVLTLGPRKPVWGVVVPFVSAYIEELVQDLEREAHRMERKLELFVDHNQWEEEIRLVGMLIREQYEAVIVVPTFDETKTAEFYRNLVSGGTLVSLLDHTMAGSYFTYAIQSYDLGVRRAAKYLLGRTQGCLVFLKNSIWIGRNMVQELMEETFLECVEEAGRPPAIVLERASDLHKELIDSKNIQGIFCCDDTDAVRVIGRLKEWGIRIPEEVSVISYGNTDLARYFTPRITSIDPHGEEMAKRIAQMIQAYQQGEDIRFCQYVIQPELVIRET